MLDFLSMDFVGDRELVDDLFDFFFRTFYNLDAILSEIFIIKSSGQRGLYYCKWRTLIEPRKKSNTTLNNGNSVDSSRILTKPEVTPPVLYL